MSNASNKRREIKKQVLSINVNRSFWCVLTGIDEPSSFEGAVENFLELRVSFPFQNQDFFVFSCSCSPPSVKRKKKKMRAYEIRRRFRLFDCNRSRGRKRKRSDPALRLENRHCFFKAVQNRVGVWNSCRRRNHRV